MVYSLTSKIIEQLLSLVSLWTENKLCDRVGACNTLDRVNLWDGVASIHFPSLLIQTLFLFPTVICTVPWYGVGLMIWDAPLDRWVEAPESKSHSADEEFAKLASDFGTETYCIFVQCQHENDECRNLPHIWHSIPNPCLMQQVKMLKFIKV